MNFFTTSKKFNQKSNYFFDIKLNQIFSYHLILSIIKLQTPSETGCFFNSIKVIFFY